MGLKAYLSRVPVGGGPVMPEESGGCPECQRQKGELHRFGCAGEPCPACGKILIGCCCNRLSPADSARIIKALHDRFTGSAAAAAVIAGAGEEAGRDVPYLVHAAMQYLYENLPAEVRVELHRSFQESHPDLVPLLQDEHGYGYYTAEQLSQALNISLAEVNEKIEAMIDAGQGIRFGDIIRLQKVN